MGPDVGPLLFLDESHATPLTRGGAAYTAGVARTSEIDTELRCGDDERERPRTCPVLGLSRFTRRSGGRSVQVVAQDLGAARVTQLRHRLRLDLADPLTRDAVD